MTTKRTDADYEEVVSPNLYFDKNFDIEAVKIFPGEYFVTARNMMLVTVLGSCIAACIRDRTTGMGGMNHFMLPGDGNDLLSSSARYGAYAMEMMINELLKMGAKRSNLEAKIFGGGNVLRGFTVANVGERNAEFAFNYLHTENIPIVAQDVLDIYPRKVYFFSHSGKVLVKKLRSLHNNTVIEREQVYSSRLKVAEVQGEVEMFDE
ncbi:MAG: chemoreceptor glutamine deamidase CheD [Gallionellaceae bacterium]|nr:chemoreceptor glutamine deamidase CheD [Gallionellaceae bacterium]